MTDTPSGEEWLDIVYQSNQKKLTRGKTPVSWLYLPNSEREIVLQLVHYKNVTRPILQDLLPGISPETLKSGLKVLKEKGYIREILVEGEIEYQAVLGRIKPLEADNLPTTIWRRLKLDTITFLEKIPLLRNVPKPTLKLIAGAAERRDYTRNEVLIWQGETSDHLFIILHGIIGITRLAPGSKTPQLLAYLKEGETLGDLGILENQSRSATATALTNVEVLVISRNDFLYLLEHFNSVAIELARKLGQQLLATNTRVGDTYSNDHLILLFKAMPNMGRTMLGSTLATTLVQTTKAQTVYTEYPSATNLPHRFGFEAGITHYHHPHGYDIVQSPINTNLPLTAQATLILDDLQNQYSNIIIGLPGGVEDGIVYLLERASQVIIISSPDEKSWQKLVELRQTIKSYIHAQKTRFFTILNHPQQDITTLKGNVTRQADFEIPFQPELVNFLKEPLIETQIPEPLTIVTKSLTDSLGRNHQIGVYLPTTVDVNQPIDTKPYVDKTMAFLGERFGGATSIKSQGVWNSDEIGLVSETVYIVRSFVTQAAMNEHLESILSYVETLKHELKQEAMAVEVDQKLIFI